MNIHIFNPEHEMALAANVKRFTAPHAGRELRHDLGYLPMVWADEGDYILVDDPEACMESMRHLRVPLHGRLMNYNDFSRYVRYLSSETPVHINPWGWDLPLREWLRGHGVNPRWLPTDEELRLWRVMSHRYWAARKLLKPLREVEGTVGEAVTVRSYIDLQHWVQRWGDVVLKAPWSSSGRGVRYLHPSRSSLEKELTPSLKGWLRHTVEQQGAVIVEPYYNKVLDFGLEFYVHEEAVVEYCGLSLFRTVHGAYTGNVIDTEEEKWKVLGRYIDTGLVRRVIDRLLQLMNYELLDHYVGPLGIDAMVVRPSDGPDNIDSHLLHPCVELNLRNTMGHVALGIQKSLTGQPHTMHIAYNGKYRLQITKEALNDSEINDA